MDEDTHQAESTSSGVPENDDLPSFPLVPKLAHMASVKICLVLWNKDSSLRFIADNFYCKNKGSLKYRRPFWEQVYQQIVESINQLNLPEPLKQKLRCFNEAITQEMERWVQLNTWITHTRKASKKALRPDGIFEYFKICLAWTNRGLIDYSATARNVILYSKHTRTAEKVELACEFCLEDILKEQYMEKLKRYVGDYSYDYRIPHYWACRLVIGDTKNFFRSDKILYGGTAYRLLPFLMNDAALRFIFNEFPQHQQEFLLDKCTWREKTETQLYLLSRGSVGLQKKFYTQNIVFNQYEFKNRILWEDCHILYFETYGTYFSNYTCLKIAEKLVSTSYMIDKIQLPINIQVYTLWTSIREESREYLLMNSSGSVLAELLDTFLYFERSSSIERLVLFLEKNCKISNYNQPAEEENPRKKFKSIDQMCKVGYRSLSRGLKKLGPRLNFMYYYFLRPNHSYKPKISINPLKYDVMQNDARDVFVELCKYNKMDEIDKVINCLFSSEKEKKAYKSTLLYPIFHKLLISDVIENDFLKSYKLLCPMADLFLQWYFKPEETTKIENFKREMLYGGNVPIVECLIEENNPKLKEVVRWFLSYDEAEFRDFKISYRRYELISLI